MIHQAGAPQTAGGTLKLCVSLRSVPISRFRVTCMRGPIRHVNLCKDWWGTLAGSCVGGPQSSSAQANSHRRVWNWAGGFPEAWV